MHHASRIVSILPTSTALLCIMHSLCMHCGQDIIMKLVADKLPTIDRQYQYHSCVMHDNTRGKQTIWFFLQITDNKYIDMVYLYLIKRTDHF